VINANILFDKNFIFKKFPICPPINTVKKRGQKSKNLSKTISFVICPATPNIEFIKINKDAEVAICLGYPAFIKKRIGLKKMPPPIPTNPEKKPITDPIRTDKIFGILFILNSLLIKDLLSMSSIVPAIVKIKNNIISNTFLEICIEAP
tara:strand:+ start:370 stop:816 length:447 start_codon:yes stop_codon:yes gene_type:complete